MKFLLVLSALLVTILVQQNEVTSAEDEFGVYCAYWNSQDDPIFLKYYPYSKRSEDYVDFDTDGKCLRRAICANTFRIVLEECKDFPVTCSNKSSYKGVFPGCCVKC